MKREQINIRDPYVMKAEGRYYLYGTRSATTWGSADGFDCYESADLENWDGPFEIYHKPEGSRFDSCYWAPECYAYQGKYYLITTLAAGDESKAVYALVSDSPKGPFTMHSKGALTPEGWRCIDGSLYFAEDGKRYLIFSHTFEDVKTADMCAVELTPELDGHVGEARVLFSAADAPWCVPVPFAKEEFGMDGDVYFSDGPTAYRMKSGKLAILWSGWTECGYAVGIAFSDNGRIDGNWSHQNEKFYPKDGGHGMLFTTYEGKMYYTLHYPNEKYKEAPVFFPVTETSDTLIISE